MGVILSFSTFGIFNLPANFVDHGLETLPPFGAQKKEQIL
jgi:hypothetical protein